MFIGEHGDLEIRAPLKASLALIQKAVTNNQTWIAKNSKKKKEFINKYRNFTIPENFLDGEQIVYQGETYKLQIGDFKNISIDDCCLFPKEFLPQARQRLIIWLKHQAHKKVAQRAKYFATITQLQHTDTKITSAKGIWGSCNSSGKLAINWRLIMAPPEILDYVIVHEIAHLKIRNHSKLFWDEVKETLPDYKKSEAWIKNYGGILML